MLLKCILKIISLSFQIIMTVFISVNWIRIFGKLVKENKRNIIEGLNNLQNVGGNKKGFSKRQYKRSLLSVKLYHMVRALILNILNMMIR